MCHSYSTYSIYIQKLQATFVWEKKKRFSIVYHSNTRPGQICLKNDFPGVKLTKSSASGTVKKIDLGTF